MNNYSRKEFLKTAGSTALFATLSIGFYGCNTTDAIDDSVTPPIETGGGNNGIEITNSGNTITLDLSNNILQGLKSQGGWFLIAAANTLIVNVDGTLIRSFTSVCTHQGCSTNWEFANNNFECTCHGSRFNTSGGVVRGPASSDLKEFSVSRTGDTVVVNKQKNETMYKVL